MTSLHVKPYGISGLEHLLTKATGEWNSLQMICLNMVSYVHHLALFLADFAHKCCSESLFAILVFSTWHHVERVGATLSLFPWYQKFGGKVFFLPCNHFHNIVIGSALKWLFLLRVNKVKIDCNQYWWVLITWHKASERKSPFHFPPLIHWTSKISVQIFSWYLCQRFWCKKNISLSSSSYSPNLSTGQTWAAFLNWCKFKSNIYQVENI